VKALGLLERIPDSRWIKPWLNTEMLEATASRLVYSEGSLRVKIYAAHESPARAQVLLFPSLINRPYILDLGRGRSLIQALVRAGIEVVLFDWGSPSDAERDLGLDSLLEGRIPRALTAVHANSEFSETDARPRTIMGHCLGGNLALLFAARQKTANSNLSIDRLICLTTPIDTANSALINTWFQIPEWDPTQFAQSLQTIPWPLLQASFLLLRPTMTPRRWIQFARHLTEKDFRESWLQMEIWSNDNVSFSSELFQDLLIPMYRDNAFTTAWRGIENLDLPIFSIAAMDDHIVPLQSARALRQSTPLAAHDFHEMRGGHIGAVISKRTREKLWPSLIEFTCGARKTYRTDEAPRANLAQKSAATVDEVSAPAMFLDPKGFAGNLDVHQSLALAQT
jgi:polyhydroxyalkanoate synthase subunit PhaC